MKARDGDTPPAELIDDHIVTKVRQWALDEPLIYEIWAFGSRVRGLDKNGRLIRADSDLDLAVTLALAKSTPEVDLQTTWRELRSRAEGALRQILPWAPDLELNEGARSANLQRYLSEGSLLVFRRGE